MKIFSFQVGLVYLFLFVHCQTSNSNHKNLVLLALLSELKKTSQTSCSEFGNFWISLNGKNGTCIQAKVQQESNRYRVWFQENMNYSLDLDFYLKEIESKYELLVRNLGENWDINKDGKIDILFSDKISPTKLILGYVSLYDTLSKDSGYDSNQRDILYLNSLVFDKVDRYLLSITVHEIQHLFRLQYQVNEDFPKPDSQWINEGTSDYIVDIVGYGPQKNRLKYFENTNGNSIFDIKYNYRYSLYYTFVSYIYYNGAKTETKRETFVRKMTSGDGTNLRANNTNNFFKSFQKYSNRYEVILGQDSKEVFSSLYGSFLWHTTNMSLNSSVIYNSSLVDKTTQYRKIFSKYPLPKIFSSLKLTQENHNITHLKPAQFLYTSFSINKNQMNENEILIQDGNHFLKYNFSLNEDFFQQQDSILTNEKYLRQYPCVHSKITESFFIDL